MNVVVHNELTGTKYPNWRSVHSASEYPYKIAWFPLGVNQIWAYEPEKPRVLAKVLKTQVPSSTCCDGCDE